MMLDRTTTHVNTEEYSILIVDDDPGMVQALATALRGSARLRFATDGPAALRLIALENPDLVLLDADMPGMDGFEVLKQIKASPITTDLPVIMVTGLTSEAHERNGLGLGAADFIGKPFRPSVVLARVRTQLNLQRVSNQLRALSRSDRQSLDHALLELKSRNEQLTETTARLQLANRALLQFIHAASHDLREPLNTVTQFTDLVLEDLTDELVFSGRQHLQRVVKAGERMKDLLGGAAAYARLISEAQDEDESVDLNEVVQDTLKRLDSSNEQSALVVESFELPFVLGSKAKVSIAIQNILLNAKQYAHPERPACLQIAAEVEGERARVFFRDNGIGIDTQYWARIFEPFKRLHRREAIAGKGLGLAICRQIAESSGGSLTIVQSSKDGSTFCLELRASKGNLLMSTDSQPKA